MTSWKFFKLIAAATVGSLLSLGVQAVEGASKKIGILTAAQGTKMAYRVYIAGLGAHCSVGAQFAHTNPTDDNYKVCVSQLMLAYPTGRSVTLTMDTLGNACHILEVTIS